MQSDIGTGKRIFLVVVPGWVPWPFTHQWYAEEMRDTARSIMDWLGFQETFLPLLRIVKTLTMLVFR